MLKKITNLVALLVLLTLLAPPLVLAQQMGAPQDATVAPDNGSPITYGLYNCPGAPPGDPHGPACDESLSSNTDAGFLQYSAGPSPVVPPGYQRIGDYYCPTFDPHGPPCFRVP